MISKEAWALFHLLQEFPFSGSIYLHFDGNGNQDLNSAGLELSACNAADIREYPGSGFTKILELRKDRIPIFKLKYALWISHKAMKECFEGPHYLTDDSTINLLEAIKLAEENLK